MLPLCIRSLLFDRALDKLTYLLMLERRNFCTHCLPINSQPPEAWIHVVIRRAASHQQPIAGIAPHMRPQVAHSRQIALVQEIKQSNPVHQFPGACTLSPWVTTSSTGCVFSPLLLEEEVVMLHRHIHRNSCPPVYHIPSSLRGVPLTYK